MRVIYYFDKIRFSDAHRYPRRSISFFSPFFFPFLPLSEWDRVCVLLCVYALDRVLMCVPVHVCVVIGHLWCVHVHWSVDG